jgi:hypothetical protein
MQVIIFFTVLLSSYIAGANDSAAGIAATGIYFKEEKNISIEREDLFISEKRIEVTYLFRNHSKKDITTEIAFPIPDYKYDLSDSTFRPMYDDFTVEINGKQIEYREEIKAFVNKTEYTKLLNDMGISIKDFGKIDAYLGYDEKKDKAPRPKPFFDEITKSQQQLLINNKLVILEANVPVPNWKVSRKYYWSQLFPASSTVTIKHSYGPYLSYGYGPNPEQISQDACIDNETLQWLNKMTSSSLATYYTSVDYILTTANNWKQPIKTFHLIINEDSHKKRVSTCFPDIIKKSPYRYEGTISNFVPRQNITVYFMGVIRDREDKSDAKIYKVSAIISIICLLVGLLLYFLYYRNKN